MATNAKDIIPFTATHPGKVLQSELEARETAPSAFAQSSGISEDDLHLLLLGKKSVSEDIAASLEKGLGIPAQIWLNMQDRYEYVTRELQAMQPSPARHPNRPLKKNFSTASDRARI